MSLFMATKCPTDFEETDKLKKLELKAQMWDKSTLLEVDSHFSPAESASCSKRYLDDNNTKDVALRKYSGKTRSSGVRENWGN